MPVDVDASFGLFNKAVDSCLLGDVAFEWQRGWNDLALIQTEPLLSLNAPS